MRKSILLGLCALYFLAATSVTAAGPWDGPHVQALAEQSKAPVKRGFWAKARRISEVVLIGGHALDVHSSLSAPQGLYEGNGLLRGPDGRFGRRGVMIKAGVVGGILLAQRLASRSGKYDKLITIINLGQGGTAFAIARRNYRMEP